VSDLPAVEAVTAAAYTIPTDQPEADGTLAWSSATLIVAHVTGGGRTGIGYTYASAACQALIEGELAAAIAGHDVFDTCAAWQAMVRAVRNIGRPGLVSCDEQAARAQLEQWTGEWRIPRVKIKIGESWGANEARDLSRIAFARQVIGPDAELYVDANGGYTRKQAVRLAHAMTDNAVTWLEEPVSSDDLDGLREVRDQVAPDVTAGEYGYDLAYFARMVDAQALDCLQVSAHCAPNLHAHVCAAVPNLRHLEYFHDHVRIESAVFEGALDPRGGVLRPDPARPSLGLVFKAAEAEQFRVA
jgi:L-alanine-DL-glutamate epimerase-like enolase superfamily enzyme